MTNYPSNLSEQEWELIQPYVKKRSNRGRPRVLSTREMVNAIFYVSKTGCQWRMLPSDFPKWKTVYDYYRDWRLDKTWDKVHDALRDRVRNSEGKKSAPTVAIVDSQSVKTLNASKQNGYDAGKKIKGRKRHIAVDTLGLILTVVVHTASIQDRVGVKALLLKLSSKFHSIIKIFADGGYTGKLINWTLCMFGWVLSIVQKVKTGFKILPKRWVVERTFGWWCFYRRLAKDYEKIATSSETQIKIVMIRIMLRRLTEPIPI